MVTRLGALCGVAFAGASSGFVTPASAQSVEADDDRREAVASEDIVVTARAANVSITGSSASAITYPLSIRTFNREQLEALNATRLADVIDLAGGVSRQNDFGGLWDKYAIRGFAGDENSGPDILVNRFGSNLGFNAPVDAATIERVEVLKGASAALSGRGEPGGSINIVTKVPLDTFHAVATASYGSWDSGRLTGDITGPVTDGLAVRVIGAAEDNGSFRDHVGSSRKLIAPSIAWRVSPDLRLLYQAQYMRTDTVLDRGIVGIGGNARAMSRDAFVGEPGDGRIAQTIFWQQASLFAQLSDAIGLELGGSHRDGSLDGYATMVDFGARGLQADGRTAGRDRRYHDFDWNDLTLRGELTAKADILGFSNELRMGVDRVRHALDFRLDRIRGTAARPLLPIDLFDPSYGTTPLPTPVPFSSRATSFRSESVYAQDIVRRGSLTLLLGARWNSFRETVVNRLAADRRLDTRNRGITPRAALSAQVARGFSLYTSWGRSLRLNPSDGNTTFDAERSRSSEIGAKLSLLGGRLEGQAALFDMVKRNVLNPNAVDPFVRTQVGRQRSRGAETEWILDLPRDVYLTGTYTYVDATITRDANATLIGSSLSNVPRHSGSIFARKQFGRLSVGGGVTYVGQRAGDPFGTSYRLPAYTIARANLSYQLRPSLTVRADVDNLFDTYYIASSYSNVWTMPGAPRNFRITAAAAF